MELWTEARTAMMVAQLGTVRAAAQKLAVHRATVTRHIDALEQHLGVKLFLRHADGYTLTSEGQSLKRFTEAADQLFDTFVDETRQAEGGLQGHIKVSTLSRAAKVLLPPIKSFLADHPDVTVSIASDYRFSALEQGDADLALRIGPRPDHPDYVVIPFRQVPVSLYGHPTYFETMGVPATQESLASHRFVGVERASGEIDICQRVGVPRDSVSLFTNDPNVAIDAVLAGVGLGFAPTIEASVNPDLLEVMPDQFRWLAEGWLVTHVDMHRSRLMQAFLSYLR